MKFVSILIDPHETPISINIHTSCIVEIIKSAPESWSSYLSPQDSYRHVRRLCMLPSASSKRLRSRFFYFSMFSRFQTARVRPRSSMIRIREKINDGSNNSSFRRYQLFPTLFTHLSFRVMIWVSSSRRGRHEESLENLSKSS